MGKIKSKLLSKKQLSYKNSSTFEQQIIFETDECKIKNTTRSCQLKEAPKLIIKCIPAANSSFLINYMRKQSDNQYLYDWENVLAYFSSAGDIVSSFAFQRNKVIVEALQSDLIIIAQGNKYGQGRIRQWNLKQNKLSFQVPYQFRNQYCEPMILVFPETKMFCICDQSQQKNQNPRSYYLSYFRYPLVNKDDKPFCITELTVQYNQHGHDMQFIKLNQRSMIGLIFSQPTPSNYCKLHIHQLNPQTKKGCWSILQFKTVFEKYPNICSLKIEDVWQIRQRTLYIRSSVQINVKKYNEAGLDLTQQEVTQIEKTQSFIWDITTNEMLKINLSTTQSHQMQFFGVYRNQKITKIIRSNMKQRNKQIGLFIIPKYQILPVQFMNLRTNKILFTEQDKNFKSTQINKTYFRYHPCYEPKCQYNFKIFDNNLQIINRQMLYLDFQAAEIVVFFISCILESCDQDLLMLVSDFVA